MSERDHHHDRQDRRDSGPEADRETEEHRHRENVGEPGPFRRDIPPECVDVLIRKNLRDQVPAGPGIGAEEIVEHDAPDGVIVQEHHSSQNADHPQERGIDRRVPEVVPPPRQAARQGEQVTSGCCYKLSQEKSPRSISR